MSVKEKYIIKSIDSNQCKEWLMYKHYAKRIPNIMQSFGLYSNDLVLQGVCTYGVPARMLNMGYGIFGGKIQVFTMELNRLVVNEGLEKNTLSYFVSKTLNMLPKPICVVSYADGNNGHHGYIYQATNWIYTGITSVENMYIDKRINKLIHPRTIVSMYGSRSLENLPDYIEMQKETSGKFRYLKFIGDRKSVFQMKNNLTYDILPYPKGQNERYDSGYKTVTQGLLF